MKKEKPAKAAAPAKKRGRTKSQCVKALAQMARDWQGWIKAGLPDAPKPTKAEMQHRCSVIWDSIKVMQGK